MNGKLSKKMMGLLLSCLCLSACAGLTKNELAASEIEATSALGIPDDRMPAGEVTRTQPHPQIKLDLSSCRLMAGTPTEVSAYRLQCIRALGYKISDRILANLQFIGKSGDKLKIENAWKLLATLVGSQRHGLLSASQFDELQDKIRRGAFSEATTFIGNAFRLVARGGDMRGTSKLFGVAVDFELFSPVDPASAINGCPANTKLAYKCKSTPKAGDHNSAADVFDSIEVCTGSSSSSATLIFEKSGLLNLASANIIANAGGVSYSAQEDDMKATLAIPTGTNPSSKDLVARFSIHLSAANLTASSTYTCNKQ